MAHNNTKKKICQLLILAFCFGLIVSLSRELLSVIKKSKRVQEIEKQLVELRIKNKKLKEKLEYVKSSEFIEKEAREKLNMAKENEVIVILPDNLKTPSLPNSQTFTKELPNWQKWLRLFF